MKIILALLLTFVFQVLSTDQIKLSGTVYDFTSSGRHPDFEQGICGLVSGLVQPTIGTDRKPVLLDRKSCISSEDSFNQWFRPVSGVNYVSTLDIYADWDESKKAYVYNNNNFFPIDGQGWGNEYRTHNYAFCLEVHNQFTYQGGETYWFRGDDDVWVFINDKLAIDLGGVHGPAEASVSLDSLGLTAGETYPFDFFFCERHTSGSSMAFSTTVKLDPCGTEDSDKDGTPDKCDNCPFGDVDLQIVKSTVVGKTVNLDLSLGDDSKKVKDGIYVVVNWGDNVEETKYINIASTLVHVYQKEGDYKINISANNPGCGSDEDDDEVKIGARIAPSCANRAQPPPS